MSVCEMWQVISQWKFCGKATSKFSRNVFCGKCEENVVVEKEVM